MQRLLYVAALFAGILSSPAHFEAAENAAEEPLYVDTYQVADLIVPIPLSSEQVEPSTGALERHLREIISPAAWKSDGSIHFHPTTLSLVIRQTKAVHEKIAGELERLRRKLDVQASLTIHVVVGPRAHIAELAEAFPGELGRYETKQLLDRLHASKQLSVADAPKITVFSKQTAEINLDGRVIAANATVSDDRRSVRLKISEGSQESRDVLGNVEIVNIHDGRSVAIRFEAGVEGAIIPPAKDAVEQLLVVTPRIIIQEEEEELVGGLDLVE